MHETAPAAEETIGRGRRRWTVLAVATAAQAALSAVQGGLPALGPLLRSQFHLSLPVVGVVLGSVSWGLVVLLVAWGWAADRLPARLVIGTGLAGSAAALTGAAFASGVWTLAGGLALAGALGGSAAIGGSAEVMRWFAREERALALGIRLTAVPVGGAAAAASLPFLVGLGGLRAALIALAGLEAAAAVAVVAWLREPERVSATVAPDIRPSPARDARVWRISISCALLVCSQIGVLTFAVLFLHDHRGVSTRAAAAVLAGIQLGGAALRLVSGRLSDRRGTRMVPLRRMALATAAAMAATAALADAPLAALVPALLATGVLTMGWNGLASTATLELAGHRRAATAIGIQQTVMRAVGTASGVGFGALAAASSWSAAFAVFGFLALAGWSAMAPLVHEESALRLEGESRLEPAG